MKNIQNNTPIRLFIFVALVGEAKPLVRFFALKKDPSIRPFTTYQGDNMVLTVSGVGKVAMSGAVAYSLALFKHPPNPVLLNIGIAGHKTASIGCLFKAAKIIDEDTGKVYYPPILNKNNPTIGVLSTVSKPMSRYEADRLYDMEGVAFYEIAIRFSSSEMVQCLKIVSDNEHTSLENINTQQVYQWLDGQMQAINRVIKNLMLLSVTLTPIKINAYQTIIEQWHFTVNEQIKLKALLLRWQVLTDDIALMINSNGVKNAKQMLVTLETSINQRAFFL